MRKMSQIGERSPALSQQFFYARGIQQSLVQNFQFGYWHRRQSYNSPTRQRAEALRNYPAQDGEHALAEAFLPTFVSLKRDPKTS